MSFVVIVCAVFVFAGYNVVNDDSHWIVYVDPIVKESPQSGSEKITLCWPPAPVYWEKSVEYSIFPYFVPDQEIKLEDYSNFEKILKYEFEIAKRSRFEILQKQNRKPIEFDTEIITDNIKSYACTIKTLPIYRESKVFI